MADKPLRWMGTSLDDLLKFSAEVRRRVGFELRAVQRGDQPSDFKPMSAVGNGVEEVRIRTEGAFRVFYIARFNEAMYVLHAFQKKTQRTSKQDIEIGQQRYNQLVRLRKEENLR